MRMLRLTVFALATYLLGIPLLIVAVAVVLALGLLAGVGFGWGVFSLLGWLALDDPNAGRSAVVFLGGGAIAFVLMVFLWNTVFALFVRVRGKPRDAAFRGLPPLRVTLRP